VSGLRHRHRQIGEVVLLPSSGAGEVTIKDLIGFCNPATEYWYAACGRLPQR